MSDDNFSMGYAMGQSNGNCNNGGGWGMNGWGDWIIILLLFCCFGGGFGFGGFGGFGGGAGLQGMATRADINEGFALENITSGIRAIQQGICDSTYALNNTITSGFNATQQGMAQGFNATQVAMMQGFNGVDRGFCNLSSQLSDCCCTTQRAIDGLNYNLATQSCDTRNLIQSTTRDLIDNQNANFRALMDYQVQREMRDKDAQISELQRASSQDRQNAYITTAMAAQTQTLIDRINPYPVPSYHVPAPYPYAGQGYGCCA